jgi:hypothetical protein
VRTTIITAGLFALALAACSDNTPSTAIEGLTNSSLVNALTTELKVTGHCETSFAPPPFPLPPSIHQIDTGTCQIAHLGRSAIFAEQDISFATGTATSNDLRFTAANGDVLRATSVGTFAPSGPGVAINAVMTFAGGTGRFVNATGEATIQGQVDFSTNTTTFSFVGGWINYR